MGALRFINPNIATPRWEAKGINDIPTILRKGKLIPYEKLSSSFTLPKGEFLTYAQIKSTLLPNTISEIEISQEAWKFWSSLNPKRRGISFFYNCLHDKLDFKVSNPLRKWAAELGVTIMETQWQKAIVHNLSTSKCSTYWEMAQKLHLRWYYTHFTCWLNSRPRNPINAGGIVV